MLVYTQVNELLGGENMRNWFKEAMEKQSISRVEIAKEADVTPEYIYMITTGERNPSVQLAKKLADILGIEWPKFFDKNTNDMLIQANNSIR